MISVLIFTKNEEQDLPDCLKSVSWSDDIHVFDSFSSDKTPEIAAAAGAKIVTRPGQDRSKPFGGNESEHRNWGIANINFKHLWVLHLDADERVTPDLHRNLELRARNAGPHSAFRVQRRDFFLGTWLRHVQASAFYVRLFRKDRVHFERLINPITVIDGSIGDLEGFLDHYPFSKGIAHWVDKHNGYSTLEAQQISRSNSEGMPFRWPRAFFEKDFNVRRAHQKELFYRLPARPLVKFIILYIVKRGFLDGRAGFAYALLQCFYELLIVLKTDEAKLKPPAGSQQSQ